MMYIWLFWLIMILHPLTHSFNSYNICLYYKVASREWQVKRSRENKARPSLVHGVHQATTTACHLLFFEMKVKVRSCGFLHLLQTPGIMRREMTPLQSSPPLKVSSGLMRDSRPQQINTQNTGNLARWMECEQGSEVGFLSHSPKHWQVAFKSGGQSRSESAQSVMVKSWLSTETSLDLWVKQAPLDWWIQ